MARVRINLDPADKILLKRKLNKNGDGQRLFTSEVRRISDAYVPFDNGSLKNTAVESVNKITYVQPYARKQYYENKGKGLRGKMWDKRAWADRGKEITRTVAKFVGGRTE
ncbi:minor capsid protein [Clostridium sp. 'White wine YQ']|uniref:minor capsid protein n=1 Tax=Clostridium sp. 'White wine YQ' TaxID=3027474 RepID=UPI0023653183|nr:minor capsid protein [Clostridium sp. 'White wine YQ']MDD7793693.1 minor capsid protein [Clostridium sp. 'White wine YQ']